MTGQILDISTGIITVDNTPIDPPEYTPADFETAIQRHIDATARHRLYRDGNTCASYGNSTVPLWAAEAAAFVAWRDAVWAQAFTDMAEGEFTGSPLDYVATLPEIEWPE